MIRFYLKLTKNIFKLNPIRTFISVLLVILAFTVYKIPNSTYFYQIERHLVENGTHYYQTTGGSVFEYDKEQTLFKDGGDSLLKIEGMSELGIILTILLCIGVLCIIVTLFIEDSEMEYALRDTIKRNIDEHIIDGEYFYVAYSRIIKRQTHHTDYPYSGSGVYNLREFLELPIFETKGDIRNKKLEKIGI
jgi:hypothetical protein